MEYDAVIAHVQAMRDRIQGILHTVEAGDLLDLEVAEEAGVVLLYCCHKGKSVTYCDHP